MKRLRRLMKRWSPSPLLYALRDLRGYMTYLPYRGSRFECPLCGASVKRMLPKKAESAALAAHSVVGAGFRQNAFCPRCRSLDRERLVYLFLIHETEIFATDHRLLHVAPVLGGLERAFRRSPHIDYVSVDLASPVAMNRVDITDMPYPDGSFDAVMCNHVLEHVPDDRKAMAGLFRVLRSGGFAILQTPLSATLAATYEDETIVTPEARRQAFGQWDHVRIYSAADYVRRLESVGFAVRVFDWTSDQRFGGAHNRYALNPAERVYVGMKTTM